MRIHTSSVDEEDDISSGNLDPFVHADFAVYWYLQDGVERRAMDTVPVVGILDGDGAHMSEEEESIWEINDDGDYAKNEESNKARFRCVACGDETVELATVYVETIYEEDC